jgi:hypothetical protein
MQIPRPPALGGALDSASHVLLRLSVAAHWLPISQPTGKSVKQQHVIKATEKGSMERRAW